ncbi:MAG: MgtC/SapB family protein [Phycisphaerales bacterium JB065]
MIEPLTLGDMLLRIGLAMVMGLCIGWNREVNNKAAGLRTMTLVAMGAAGMVVAAVEVVAATENAYDPLRVISGVIGGIGFLGAGTIIQSAGKVQGLTTAASIWASAGLGIACGLGLYDLAGVMFAMMIIVLVVLSSLKGEVLPEKDSEGDGGEG